MSEDLYAILGVDKDASADAIRKAYRKLARKHHPDLNPNDPAAEERFKHITAAYEILNNAEKRALYDELGPDAEKIGYDPERAEEYRQWRRRAEAAAGFRGAPGGAGFDPFGGAGGAAGHGDLEDLIAEMFSRQARGPRRGRDVEAQLRVSFRDAALGAKAQVDLPQADGTTSRVQLTIPAGVADGQRLRLGGKGTPGREGGSAGDLYVRIEVAPHPVFRRDGLDLELTLPLTIAEALAGAQVEVPTLDGSVKVKVPPGTQPGRRLRLRGKGVRPAKGEPGDLFAQIEVRMPEGVDEETRARLAAELAALYRDDVRAELHREAAR